MSRILIAEDEPRIASFLDKGLRANGFTTTITQESDAAIDMALSGSFDLLLLDLGLPCKDGLAILAELRGQGAELSIIILTARDDLQNKVAGLEGGADDYVTKPFRFEELLARVRLRLRNNQASLPKDEMLLHHGDLIINLRTRQVFYENHNIELSTREFLLLETLVVIKDRFSAVSNY